MDRITLFPVTPPASGAHPPLARIQVPERWRAELYRAELEDTRLVLEAYAERHPRAAPALLEPALIEALAVLLDDYVGPAVVADVNAYADSTFPGGNITLDTYRQYCAACLQNDADPYVPSAATAPPGRPAPADDWSGLQAFYRRYPMVRFMVGTVTESYQRNLQRCCDRVLEDWPDLETYFFNATAMSALTGIETTGSDFHKGGGQVLLLKFVDAAAQTWRLVYKPTDVERDFRIVGDTQPLAAALNAVPPTLRVVPRKGTTAAALLNNAGGSLGEMLTAQAAATVGYVVPVYRILPVWPGSGLAAAANGQLPIRESYGYLEFLTSLPADNRFATAAQRQAYYQSLGAAAALCWIFQVTDLHQENLIVHGHQPFLIDLEMSYSGLMELPGDTNLNSAYKIFTVGSTRRVVTGFGTPALGFDSGPVPAEPTKNALYDAAGTPAPPGAVDNSTLRGAFFQSVTLILQQQAAYLAWLAAAQHVVTRILPEGTLALLRTLRVFNDPDVGGAGVSFPDEVALRTQRNGDFDLQGWGNQFFLGALPGGMLVTPAALALAYDGLAPTFSIWFDPQTAADFRAGDVPAYYRRMSSADAMGSSGRPLQVDYGLAIQKTAAAQQQPVANALVTLWGTPAPLLPASYFPAAASTSQTNYLQALALNAGGFTTARLTAAIAEIASW